MRRYSWIFGLEDVRSIVLDAEDVQRLRQENSALRRHTSGLFILERVLHPGISEEGIYDVTYIHTYLYVYEYIVVQKLVQKFDAVAKLQHDCIVV